MMPSVKKAGKQTVAPAFGLARLGDLLPHLLAKYGVHRRRNVEEINAAWKAAVGLPYDKVCRVIGLSRGTLEVTVPHPAFIQELSFRKTELLQSMQTALPDEKIKKIKFSDQPWIPFKVNPYN